MKILTEKQYNAAVNKAFWEGYKCGFDYAEQKAVFKENTLNSIREKLGLKELPKERGGN